MAAPLNYLEGPILSEIAVELKTIIKDSSCLFGSTWLRMTSDQFLTVISPGDAWTNPEVYYLNLTNLQEPKVDTLLYHKFTAGENLQSCVLNRTGEWCLQQNLEHKVWLRNVKEPGKNGKRVSAGEFVQLVTWLSADIFAIVKTQEILHMNVAGGIICKVRINEAYSKQRAVTDYSISPNGLWAVATGIRLESHRVSGMLMAIRLQDNMILEINGMAGEFLPPSSQDGVQTLLAIADRINDQSVTFAVFALPHATIPQFSVKFRVDVLCPSASTSVRLVDFPVAVKMSELHHLAFLVTKFGHVHVFDSCVGTYLGSKRITTQKILALVGHRKTAGIMSVDYDGNVRTSRLDLEATLNLLSTNFGNEKAVDFAARHGLPVQPNLFVEYFLRILAVDTDRAIALANSNVEGLPGPEALRILTACLRNAGKRFLHIVVRLSTKVRTSVGVEALAEMFEASGYPEGLFSFLNGVGGSNLHGEMLIKFVRIAVQQKQFGALEHFVKVLKVQEPEKVMNCLMVLESGLPVAKMMLLIEPLCTRYGMIEDLAGYFLRKKLGDSINMLVASADNAAKLRRIMRILLRNECRTKDLQKHLSFAKHDLLGDELVQEFEAHQRLQIFTEFLELLVGNNDPSPSVNTTLLNLYIKSDEGCSAKVLKFVRENQFYDFLEIGKQFESLNPVIALMIYRSRKCDEKFMEVSNSNDLFEEQIGYLLSRRQLALWTLAFCETNTSRQKLVEEIVVRFSSGRNEPVDFETVSVMIEAMAQQSSLGTDAIRLLGRLISGNTCKEQLRFYENLFLSMLINVGFGSASLEDYVIVRFKNYDHEAVAYALVAANFQELAIKVLILGKCFLKAVEVMAGSCTNLDDLRAIADKCEDPQVWTFVGKHLLDKGKVVDSLRLFIRARNYSHYKLLYKLVSADSTFVEWDMLISYFEGVKRTTQDPDVNSTMAVILAKGNRFEELEKHFKSSLDESVQQTQGCRICEDGLKEVTFSPCGHVVACRNCSEWLQECPICRKPIESKMRIFHS